MEMRFHAVLAVHGPNVEGARPMEDLHGSLSMERRPWSDAHGGSKKRRKVTFLKQRRKSDLTEGKYVFFG